MFCIILKKKKKKNLHLKKLIFHYTDLRSSVEARDSANKMPGPKLKKCKCHVATRAFDLALPCPVLAVGCAEQSETNLLSLGWGFAELGPTILSANNA